MCIYITVCIHTYIYILHFFSLGQTCSVPGWKLETEEHPARDSGAPVWKGSASGVEKAPWPCARSVAATYAGGGRAGVNHPISKAKDAYTPPPLERTRRTPNHRL